MITISKFKYAMTALLELKQVKLYSTGKYEGKRSSTNNHDQSCYSLLSLSLSLSHTHTHMHAHMHSHVGAHMHACKNKYTHIYACMYTHTHTHTHIL